MKYVLLGILIYLAYQFIFKLVIPVYRTSRRIKKGFREMHERMQAQQQNTHKPDFATTNTGKSTQPDPADYIEFEEIK